MDTLTLLLIKIPHIFLQLDNKNIILKRKGKAALQDIKIYHKFPIIEIAQFWPKGRKTIVTGDKMQK